MSRRALALIVGITGTLLAIAMYVGMSVMGSIVADARTANISGPGVDVFLRTPLPGEGSDIILDVEARGGNKAGIRRVVVRSQDTVLAEAEGDGVTWGSTIRRGKGRGAETTTVHFSVPRQARAGERLSLDIDVEYVVAMSSGSTFDNVDRSDTVRLDVDIYSERGRLAARLLLGARALAYFLAWFGLVWGVAVLYARAGERGPMPGNHDAELEGIGLVMGVMGGGFVGYWIFARTVLAALESQRTAWEVLLTALWLVLPLVWVWRRSKRRVKLGRYVLSLASGADGPNEVEPAEISRWLGGASPRGQSIAAQLGAEHVRVAWTGERVTVDGLAIDSSDSRPVFELARSIAGQVGPVSVATPTGLTVDVDAQRSVDEVERGYQEAVHAEAMRVIQRMGARRGEAPG